MARWTLSVMAVVLVAVLVGGVWWEARWRSVGYPRGMAQVVVGRGGIRFDGLLYNPPMPASRAASSYGGFWCRRHDGRMHWRPAYVTMGTPGASQRIVYIPIWMPLVLVAGAAGFCWRRDVRRRRRDRIIKAGGCPNCGYDLRGLRAQGEARGEKTEARGEWTEARAVCPECGR